MEIQLEPGTIPSVVVYNTITSANVSSVYVNGAISSIGTEVSNLDNTVSLIRLQQPIDTNQVVQLFVQNSPGSGDVLGVTFVGNPATTATITNIESNNAKLEEKLYKLEQDMLQLQKGIERLSQQLYQMGR